MKKSATGKAKKKGAKSGGVQARISGLDDVAFADIMIRVMAIHGVAAFKSPPFLGDSRYLHCAETCPCCGSAMEPKVFYGNVYGWRCVTCDPLHMPTSYSLVNGKAVLAYD